MSVHNFTYSGMGALISKSRGELVKEKKKRVCTDCRRWSHSAAFLGSSRNEKIIEGFAHLNAPVSSQSCLALAPSLRPVFPTVGASMPLLHNSFFISVTGYCFPCSVWVETRKNRHVICLIHICNSAVKPLHFFHLILVACWGRTIVTKPTNSRREHQGSNRKGVFNVGIAISQP